MKSLSINIICLIFIHSFPITRANSDSIKTQSSEGEILDYENLNAKQLKTQILNTVLGDSYDPTVRPSGLNNGRGPVHINISFIIRSIENIDDINMEYTAQFTYRQQWIDQRVSFGHLLPNNTSAYNNNMGDTNYIYLLNPDRIWSPDIMFSNEKSSSIHELIIPNKFTRIYSNGLILQSFRITAKLNCAMDLRSYPLDIQKCPIYIESYGWTVNDLMLDWRHGNPIELSSDFPNARFKLSNYNLSSDCFVITSTGNYSCIEIYFTFNRQFGFYLIQFFIPSALLVVISWVSFWLEPTAAEARVSLGVTTVLAIVTEVHGINQNAPPSSYTKALDIWTATCQSMVIAALLQFSYVNYIAEHLPKTLGRYIRNDDDEHGLTKEERIDLLKESSYRKAKRIDWYSQIIFPTFFIIFNIIYWKYYGQKYYIENMNN